MEIRETFVLDYNVTCPSNKSQTLPRGSRKRKEERKMIQILIVGRSEEASELDKTMHSCRLKRRNAPSSIIAFECCWVIQKVKAGPHMGEGGGGFFLLFDQSQSVFPNTFRVVGFWAFKRHPSYHTAHPYLHNLILLYIVLPLFDGEV